MELVARLRLGYGLLALRRSREVLRTRRGALLAATVALVYALLSMVEGGMVAAGTPGTPVTSQVIRYAAGDYAWWDYPAYVYASPQIFLDLPYLPTLTMIVVSVGVGIGMSVGLVLAARLLAPSLRRSRSAAPLGQGERVGAVGTLAGLTPAMLALLTLGACCSVTAAAAAGVGAVATASGENPYALESNTWYLSVFQVAVLWVALVAQEELLLVYGGLLGVRFSEGVTYQPRAVDRRFVAGGLLRVLALTAGVLWLLAVPASWAAIQPTGTWGGNLLSWTVQHLLPGGLVLLAAFVPREVGRALTDRARRVPLGVLRALVVLGGVTSATWTPAPLAQAGFYGWGNELLGYLHAPAGQGAVAPATAYVPGLVLYWGFLYVFLGILAIALALAPERALAPFRWATADVVPEEGPDPEGGSAPEVPNAVSPSTTVPQAP